jgi:hypothetical protein
MNEFTHIRPPENNGQLKILMQVSYLLREFDFRERNKRLLVHS